MNKDQAKGSTETFQERCRNKLEN